MSTPHERLTLLFARLLDDVPPLKLAHHVANLTAYGDVSLESPTAFATWHHAGLRAFVEDLARHVLSEPSPAERDEPPRQP